MLDMCNGSRTPDNEVIFYDAILYVICRNGEEFTCDQIILCVEYDVPLSLADILKIYPNVWMLIAEDALYSKVYQYGNHRDEGWELKGEVLGYA